MPWNLGAGVAAAANTGGDLMLDSIKRDRNLQDATNIEALKAKVEQDKLDRIAGIVKGVSRTTTVGSFDEMGSPTTVTRPKSDSAYSREVGDALTGAGFIDQGGKAYDRAERHDDKLDLRTTQAARQKSDDEKWHATNTELIRHHKSLEAKAAAQLGLKDKEAKDFAATVDSYITNKSQYESLRASGKNEQYLIDAAKEGMDGDALKLKQFRVDVGDQSDLAKHMNLSASLTALNATIDKKRMDGKDTTADEATRDGVVKAIAAIATGSKGAVNSTPTIEPPKAAVDMLLSGKGTDAMFDKTFGAGSAAKARAGGSSAKTVSVKPGIIDEAAASNGYTDEDRELASLYGPFGGLVKHSRNSVKDEEARRRQYIADNK